MLHCSTTCRNELPRVAALRGANLFVPKTILSISLLAEKTTAGKALFSFFPNRLFFVLFFSFTISHPCTYFIAPIRRNISNKIKRNGQVIHSNTETETGALRSTSQNLSDDRYRGSPSDSKRQKIMIQRLGQARQKKCNLLKAKLRGNRFDLSLLKKHARASVQLLGGRGRGTDPNFPSEKLDK